MNARLGILFSLIIFCVFQLFECNCSSGDGSNFGENDSHLQAPGNLQVASVSSTHIGLLWEDNSDNEDGFKIERRLIDGSYSEIDTIASDVTSYSDTGLSVNKEYFYRIRAYNATGNSDYSNQADCKTMIPGWNFDQFTDMEKEYGPTDTTILQHYPSLQEILDKPARDIPVYGLYTWSSSWGAWWHWYDEISQVGWRTIRVAGIRDL
ncbi:MAG: fibronectin type III domain-containing protein, partial [Spirochaetota bacterium]|nr:fibronectin type III domain-containing protein [Spirochaetota bacterium]